MVDKRAKEWLDLVDAFVDNQLFNAEIDSIPENNRKPRESSLGRVQKLRFVRSNLHLLIRMKKGVCTVTEVNRTIGFSRTTRAHSRGSIYLFPWLEPMSIYRFKQGIR